MSDTIQKQINITTNSSDVNAQLGSVDNTLNNLGTSQTKVTQSTKSLHKEVGSTTEAIVKNGGAMGILNDLTGGLAMVFKDASEAIELTGVSLKSFRGIMLSTGLGAIVILLGSIIANWESLTKAIDSSSQSIDRMNLALEAQQSDYQSLTSEMDYYLALLEAQGVSQETIQKQRETNFFINKSQLEQQIKDLESLNGSLKAADESAIGLGKNLFGGGNSEEILKNMDKIAELYKAIEDNAKELNISTAQYETDRRKSLKEDLAKRVEASRKAQEQLRLEAKQTLEDLVRINKTVYAGVDQFMTSFGTWKISSKVSDELTILRDSVQVIGEGVDQAKLAIDKLNKSQYLTPAQRQQLQNEISLHENQREVLKIVSKAQAEYQANLMESIAAGKGVTDTELRRATIMSQLSRALEDTNLSLIDSLPIKQRLLLIDREAGTLAKEKALQDIESAKKLVSDDIARISSKKTLSEQELQLLIKLQDEQLALEQQGITASHELKAYNLETNTMYYNLDADAAIDATQRAADAKKEAELEYWNAVQTAGQNTIGFLSMLQNESLVKSRDLRNTFLVLEKGLAIAQIVMGTIRQNSELRMKASGYTSDAIAAYAQALIPGPQSALYAAAGAGLTAAAAKTTAQIPLNWAGAGMSIAGVVAQTLTSWNKPSEGGSSGGAGGAGGQAQFNIVESSGNNQLAASIGAKQNQPVNAYVVGSDVSTQQALDRNKITNATFL
jgi:hypothetical protein